jgi:alkanesulfonate monooxygenase
LADGWIAYFYTPDSFEKSWSKVLDSAKSFGKQANAFGNCDMVPIRIDRSEAEARRVTTDFITKHCDLPAWSEATPNSAVTGTSKDCAQMIESFSEAGVQELVFMPAVAQLSEIGEQVEKIAKELLPSFS